MIIKTKHGDFPVTRKNVVAISVVSIKRPVRHHRQYRVCGELTHIEHRKIPTSTPIVGSWAEYIATYDLDGNRLELCD